MRRSLIILAGICLVSLMGNVQASPPPPADSAATLEQQMALVDQHLQAIDKRLAALEENQNRIFAWAKRAGKPIENPRGYNWR